MVYLNVLGREAEPDGFAYWVDQADRGLSRGELVLLGIGFTGVHQLSPVASRQPS